MSATLSGVVVLENVGTVEGLPSTICFNGQMWLAPEQTLTGVFRYYNTYNATFPEIGTYFAWIHVANHEVFDHTEKANTVEDPIVGDKRPHDSQSEDESHIADSLGITPSDNGNDVFHVAGDILLSTTIDDPRQQPFINVSGATVNCNKTEGVFYVNAAQYTSHYKSDKSRSVLPVRGVFNAAKYKNKKPVPSDNKYIAFEGFLGGVDTDSSGHAKFFIVSVDNINFLGKAPTSS
ncbi:hypothetical protein F5888DRAFT_1810483 [Russula emetica]|nr:hypothetical protein F5888DRAFT_1810483 [Russula emetica]